MNPFIHWNPNPVAFTIPGLNWPVRWYGISWALGFFLSSYAMTLIYRAEGKPEERVDRLTLYMMVSTLVGARLGHCLFYDPIRYLSNPLEILMVFEGGLASHGAALGILTGLWLYSKRYHERLWWVLDRMMVVVPLACSMIRFGNFMNSEIVGKVTDVPWAFVFTQVDQQPRHPAQLYEAVFYLVLFFVMFSLWKNRRNRYGEKFLFGFLFTVIFSFRFLVEFVKENQVSFESGMFINMGQWLSIPFILLGVYCLRDSFRKRPRSK